MIYRSIPCYILVLTASLCSAMEKELSSLPKPTYSKPIYYYTYEDNYLTSDTLKICYLKKSDIKLLNHIYRNALKNEQLSVMQSLRCSKNGKEKTFWLDSTFKLRGKTDDTPQMIAKKISRAKALKLIVTLGKTYTDQTSSFVLNSNGSNFLAREYEKQEKKIEKMRKKQKEMAKTLRQLKKDVSACQEELKKN